MARILIIGAGICGLTAGAELAKQGHAITIVDKGRSVGGRLATRRIGGGRADHGAQFFTARSAPFSADVQEWMQQDLAYVWSNGWSDGNAAAQERNGHPRYAIQGGMNQLAKRLAANLAALGNVSIQTQRLIRSLANQGAGWRAESEGEHEFSADIAILTSPAAQSVAIVEAGPTQLAPGDRAALNKIDYAPSLCGLLHLSATPALPAPGALQREEARFRWIADNQRKGISPEASIITIHASAAYSRTHYDRIDSATLDEMAQELQEFLPPGAVVIERQLKRWRYALPTQLHPEPFLRAQGLPPLYFGGDAFGGHPRVEGAVLSAMAIAAAIGAAH